MDWRVWLERVRMDASVRVPYPVPLQRAVNRMTVVCRVRGLEPVLVENLVTGRELGF